MVREQKGGEGFGCGFRVVSDFVGRRSEESEAFFREGFGDEDLERRRGGLGGRGGRGGDG